MDKLISLWDFVGRHKYLITLAVAFVVIGFLDRNSLSPAAREFSRRVRQFAAGL